MTGLNGGRVIKRGYWQSYWDHEPHGGHRYQTDDFLQMEAREKLFHLDGGRSLLDFGCGSADLLVYYAKAYDRVVGVDFSAGMLEKARKRLQAHGCLEKVTVLQADERTVWEQLPPSALFDRITAAGVVQNLAESQLEHLLAQAVQWLNPGGRIVLFDVIDSRLFWLFRLGVLRKDNGPSAGWLSIAGSAVRQARTCLTWRLTGLPPCGWGYVLNAYHPSVIGHMAKRLGLEMQRLASMYYEYRYHVILAPRTGPAPGSPGTARKAESPVPE